MVVKEDDPASYLEGANYVKLQGGPAPENQWLEDGFTPFWSLGTLRTAHRDSRWEASIVLGENMWKNLRSGNVKIFKGQERVGAPNNVP